MKNKLPGYLNPNGWVKLRTQIIIAGLGIRQRLDDVTSTFFFCSDHGG